MGPFGVAKKIYLKKRAPLFVGTNGSIGKKDGSAMDQPNNIIRDENIAPPSSLNDSTTP